MEENVLRQKFKVDWIKLGDSNNHFFHAKTKQKRMYVCRPDGSELTSRDEIEKEVLLYFGELMGNED